MPRPVVLSTTLLRIAKMFHHSRIIRDLFLSICLALCGLRWDSPFHVKGSCSIRPSTSAHISVKPLVLPPALSLPKSLLAATLDTTFDVCLVCCVLEVRFPLHKVKSRKITLSRDWSGLSDCRRVAPLLHGIYLLPASLVLG